MSSSHEWFHFESKHKTKNEVFCLDTILNEYADNDWRKMYNKNNFYYNKLRENPY